MIFYVGGRKSGKTSKIIEAIENIDTYGVETYIAVICFNKRAADIFRERIDKRKKLASYYRKHVHFFNGLKEYYGIVRKYEYDYIFYDELSLILPRGKAELCQSVSTITKDGSNSVKFLDIAIHDILNIRDQSIKKKLLKSFLFDCDTDKVYLNNAAEKSNDIYTIRVYDRASHGEHFTEYSNVYNCHLNEDTLVIKQKEKETIIFKDSIWSYEIV